MSAPATPSIYDKCGGCQHYPAYHDQGKQHACRAWAPDESGDQAASSRCPCKAWEPPK